MIHSRTGSVAAEIIADPADLEGKDYPFTQDHLDRIQFAKRLGLKLKLYVLSEGGVTKLMAVAIVG